MRVFSALFQKGVDALTDRCHRGFRSLPHERIHIARDDAHTGLPLRLLRDPDQICPEQRVHAGDAEHNDLRTHFRHLDDLPDRLRDPAQVSAGHKIRLIHQEIEHPLTVAADPAQDRAVPPAAPRGDQQHDRLRDRESRALHTVAVGSRRIVGQGRRRAVYERGGRQFFLRKILASAARKLLRCQIKRFHGNPPQR